MQSNSIYEKIILKGEQDKERILLEGEKKTREIEQTMLEEANKEIQKLEKVRLESASENLKTATSKIEQRLRKRTLETKKQLIEKVFLQAKAKLQTLSDEEYFNLVVSLLEKEKLTGKESLCVATDDVLRYVRLFSTAKKEQDHYVLDKLSKKLNLSDNLTLLATGVNIDGGFILMSENYDSDYSFSTIIKTIMDKHEAKIAKVLFKESE